MQLMNIVHRIQLLLSAAYIIEGNAGLVLVDAGLPGEEQRILGFLRRLRRDDLRLIYITHAHIDHYGSAAALRAITGAEVVVHEADGPAMANGQTQLGTTKGPGRLIGSLLPLLERMRRPPPTAADRLLDDGDSLEEFGLHGRVLHTPGHTVGSSCLIVDERLAFSGDLVTSTGGPHLQHYFAEDWPSLPASLARLQNVNPEWVYPGHGRKPIGRDELRQINTPVD
jgi:hydroxyacylglutathione hydrolase